jgi:phenylacetate-CoA ligase
LKLTWGCEVYNHYGMTETGLGGGVSCAAQRGYHLREADLYFEIINPVNGQPVETGEAGEVVFTTLTRQGMPLVRYRSGDISRFLPGVCPCGTSLKTLQWIQGRIGGSVRLGGGMLALPELDEALFSLPCIYDYSIVVKHDHNFDGLHIKVFCKAGTDTAAIQRALETLPLVRDCLKTQCLRLNVSLCAGLPPDLGKMTKRVIKEE